MKNEREIVEEKEETAGSQPCKRKRLTEVMIADFFILVEKEDFFALEKFY